LTVPGSLVLDSRVEEGPMLVELGVVEQRLAAVFAVRDGETKAEVGRRVGVSRQTVHAWCVRFAELGAAGLADRSHRPVGCPHQMDPVIEQLVVDLRVDHPWWGPRRLIHELASRGVVSTRSAVLRALHRHGLVAPAPVRRVPREQLHRFERAFPMDLWQVDLTGSLRLAQGARGPHCPKIVTGIDDHSRFCVMAVVVEHETSRAVVAAIQAAFDTYGAPDEVLTDNGKVFTARHNPGQGETGFDRICRQHGASHVLTGPYHPQTNGKVERFHGTLQRELLDRVVFDDLTHAAAAVEAYRLHYNTERPMTYDDSPTTSPDNPPAGRFLAPRRHQPGPQQNTDLERIRIATGHLHTGNHARRRIASNGTFWWRQNWIYIGQRHVGSEVRIVEIDDVVHVFLANELLKIHPLAGHATA
jgi:transposase InsO family protein